MVTLGGIDEMAKPNPIPPKDCTCASFWTIRHEHKKDCPLSNPSAGVCVGGVCVVLLDGETLEHVFNTYGFCLWCGQKQIPTQTRKDFVPSHLVDPFLDEEDAIVAKIVGEIYNKENILKSIIPSKWKHPIKYWTWKHQMKGNYKLNVDVGKSLPKGEIATHSKKGNEITINVDKFEQELKSQELMLSEDEWMSVIVSLKRAEVKS